MDLEQAKNYVVGKSYTVVTWGAVITFLVVASNVGSLLTKVDAMQTQIQLQQQLIAENSKKSSETEKQVTRLEVQYDRILDEIREIKGLFQNVTPK